jgi:hypothetical protein
MTPERITTMRMKPRIKTLLPYKKCTDWRCQVKIDYFFCGGGPVRHGLCSSWSQRQRTGFGTRTHSTHRTWGRWHQRVSSCFSCRSQWSSRIKNRQQQQQSRFEAYHHTVLERETLGTITYYGHSPTGTPPSLVSRKDGKRK